MALISFDYPYRWCHIFSPDATAKAARPRLRPSTHALRTADGSDRHSRRPATQGPYPHLRRQKCRAHAIAVRAAHRRAADFAQPATARRRRWLWPSAQPARLLDDDRGIRSEEHTSELQSLMRISYAVFCLKTKTYIALTH